MIHAIVSLPLYFLTFFSYLVEMGCLPPMCRLMDSEDVRVIKVGIFRCEDTVSCRRARVMVWRSLTPLLTLQQQVVMDGFQNILQVGQRRDATNEFRQALEETQGIEKLQLFVFHENEQIAAQARLILDRYIGDPDELA